MLELVCTGCSKTFLTPLRQKVTVGRYCSYPCFVKYWKLRNPRSLAELICPACEKTFLVHVNKVRFRKYCSRQCRPEYRSPRVPLKERPLHHVWRAMKARCLNQNHPFWRRYGGRGISVCPQWLNDFPCFEQWASSHGYAPGLTLDRKNNDGDYAPGNCRFVTQREQTRNTVRNRMVSAFGETKDLADWADDPRCVVCYGTLHDRIINRGVLPESAIQTRAYKLCRTTHVS